MPTVDAVTLTDDRTDERIDRADGLPDERASSGVERMVWFSGGFIVTLHLVVLVGLGVLAYGSDALDLRRGADDPVAGVESVFVATEFAYDPSDAREADGQLTITLVNRGAIFHNLLIEEVGGFVLEADAGVTSSAPIQLEDGVFTLYCSVPGHRELGMEATLTVGSS